MEAYESRTITKKITLTNLKLNVLWCYTGIWFRKRSTSSSSFGSCQGIICAIPSIAMVFKDTLLREMIQGESFTIKINFGDRERKKKWSTFFQLRKILLSCSESKQNIEHRRNHIPQQENDKLNNAIENREAETGTSKEGHFSEVWSDLRYINEYEGLSCCTDEGCFDPWNILKNQLPNFNEGREPSVNAAHDHCTSTIQRSGTTISKKIYYTEVNGWRKAYILYKEPSTHALK